MEREEEIFTGAVLKKLTSTGAILAESGAHQMPCGWSSLGVFSSSEPEEPTVALI